ncbi:MAG: hypothetical protein H7837_06180 [Magnetococcus sp. MYC-9]
MKITPALLSLAFLCALAPASAWAAWPLESDCKDPSKLLAGYNRMGNHTKKECYESTKGIAGGGSKRLTCCRSYEEQWYADVTRVCAPVVAKGNKQKSGSGGSSSSSLIPEGARKTWITECTK